MLDRLHEQHQGIRQIAASLLVLLNRPDPADPATLAAKRWEMARSVLQHLPMEERNVYRPLLEQPDPAIVRLVERSMIALNQLYGRFQSHSERWTGDAAAASWDTYRHSATELMENLLNRMEHEETVLYPHVAALHHVDTTRRPTDRNWAGEAEALRHLIRTG